MPDFCPECGTENNSDSLYCEKCGTALYVATPETDSKEEKKYSGSIALGYIFSILGGIIGLAIALYLVSRDNARAKFHGKINLLILLTWIVFFSLIINIYVGIILLLIDGALFYFVLTKKI